MKLYRSFIALELPEAVRDSLGELQEKLRPLTREVNWTRPENIHLTLFFLGEITGERLEAVGEKLKEGFGNIEPFPLRPEGAGGFPNASRARVVVARVGGEVRTLALLLEELNKKLLSLGFPPEEREFKPHLTIGRVKRDRRHADLREPLSAVTGYEGPSWRVENVVLYTSDLQPGGAVYTPRVTVSIGRQKET